AFARRPVPAAPRTAARRTLRAPEPRWAGRVAAGSGPRSLFTCQKPRRAWFLLFDVQEAFSYRVDDGFHTGVEVQLLEDVADVVLDGVLGDEELLGDVPVVVAPGDELEDLQLPVGQPGSRDAGPLVGALHHAGELVEQLGGHGGRDERLPGVHGPHRVRHLLDGDLLQQVPGSAGLDGVVEVG